nr:EOG090X0266 [Lepidurus arcticus]
MSNPTKTKKKNVAAAPVVPESVLKCVNALQAVKSDTEKFAALFMVTKVIKADDECDPHSLKLIFEAISFDFLRRLLLAQAAPEGCPPVMYKTVALSVLSSFMSLPEAYNHPEMSSIMSVLLNIIDADMDSDDFQDNLTLVSDAYECLLAIAGTKAGRKIFVEQGGLERVVEIYVEELFKHDQALELLGSLIHADGKQLMATRPKLYERLLERLANDFDSDTSFHKFDLCIHLSNLIAACPHPLATYQDAAWPKVVMKSLAEIVCSKVGPDQRNPALHLTSRLLELLGLDWTLSLGPSSRQFLLLLVNLSCVEIRMHLENKTPEEALSQADILMPCYTVAELFVSYMMTGAFMDFEQKQKEQVYCALKGALGAVLAFLHDIAQESQERHWKADKPQTIFVCATIRLLGCWLAEETSSNRQEICAVLPFIIRVCTALYDQRKKSMPDRSPSGKKKAKETAALPPVIDMPDPLRFMLPALCHLIAEDNARKILLDEDIHELMFDYLQYHWQLFWDWLRVQPPPPLDWIASEQAAAAASSAASPFDLSSDETGKEPKGQDSETAMCTICSILMNVVVLEPKLVTENATFHQILKFAMARVPDLGHKADRLVLHGNFAVLALLLLRHHAWRIREGDMAVFRYIQGTVSFLWDAHNSEESADALTLVISLRYKKNWPDLAELWFLGMQSLSNLLGKLPWVVDFIMDSGWAQDIVKTLQKIVAGGIDASTRTAYEDILLSLIKANPSLVLPVFKDAGLKGVCQTHGLKELLQIVVEGPVPAAAVPK